VIKCDYFDYRKYRDYRDYCHFLIHALNCRKRSHSHLEDAETESDTESKGSSRKSRKNREGLPVLHNGVISVKGLKLSQAIVSKSLYDGTQTLRLGDADLTLSMGGAFPLGILVLCADKVPVERHRDRNTRMLNFISMAQFALPPDLLHMVLESEPGDQDAWLVGYAKSAQQKLK